jgi:hypothetical protein
MSQTSSTVSRIQITRVAETTAHQSTEFERSLVQLDSPTWLGQGLAFCESDTGTGNFNMASVMTASGPSLLFVKFKSLPAFKR